MTSPRRTVVSGRPTRVAPSYADQPHLDCTSSAVMNQVASASKTTRSASYPTSIRPLLRPRPNSSAGRPAASRVSWDSSSSTGRSGQRCRIPVKTAGSSSCTPGSPGGASAGGLVFSSTVCGAWSLPRVASPSWMSASHSRSRSRSSRMAGLSRMRAPRRVMSLRVKDRWCGVASKVTGRPASRAAISRSHSSAEEVCRMWAAVPYSRTSSMTRATATIPPVRGRAGSYAR